MSDFNHEFDTDADHTATRPGQLSSNAHWIFGSVFAFMILAGFSFGVWAGASRSKPVEPAEKKDKDKDKDRDSAARPNDPPVKPPVQPPQPNPNPNANPNPAPVDPKPMDPKPKDPEPVQPKPMETKPLDPKTEPASSAKPDNGLASIGSGLMKEPGTTVPATPVVAGKAVSFNKEVQPILRTYCGNCHGLAGKPKGGVDLRTIAGIMKGGDNGDVLKVGDPKKSTLYTSMQPGANEQMPPDGKPQPTEKEKQVIHDWIASGAKPRRTAVRRRPRRGSASRMELTPGGDAG